MTLVDVTSCLEYQWNDLMVQEESSRREAEAYFSAYVRGRGSRGGRAGVGIRG